MLSMSLFNVRTYFLSLTYKQYHHLDNLHSISVLMLMKDIVYNLYLLPYFLRLNKMVWKGFLLFLFSDTLCKRVPKINGSIIK